MRDISDIWYLVKLAIKTATFLVIFGGGGWLLYTYPSKVSQPPRLRKSFGRVLKSSCKHIRAN